MANEAKKPMPAGAVVRPISQPMKAGTTTGLGQLSPDNSQRMNLDLGATARPDAPTWRVQTGQGTSGIGPQIPPNQPATAKPQSGLVRAIEQPPAKVESVKIESAKEPATARPESGLITTDGIPPTKIGGKPAAKQTPLISKLPGAGALPHSLNIKDRSSG